MLLKPDIRVIGVGSHHAADATGWLACEKLQTQITSRQIDWQLCRTPAQLPGLMQNFHTVVILDAMLSDKPVGHVLTLAWSGQQDGYQSPCSSHDLNVIESLQLASALEQLPLHTYIMGISISLQQQDVSQAVSIALPQLQQALTQILNTATH